MKIQFFLCIFFTGYVLPVLTAQENVQPVSHTYFIKNGTLIPKPGVVLPGQHVLIRDGVIIETGPAVRQPFDAQVIAADSMYIYAGFIDGYSNTGIPKTESKERPKGFVPGSPPNPVAGITPDAMATQLFTMSDKSIADMRNVGFSVSHAVPRGLMLPGQSALFILGDAANPDKMLLKSGAAQHFQFETQRGAYPSTTIGVMAKFRDLYKNANLEGTHDALFQNTASGMERPDYSRELMALYPVTVRKQPLFIVASKTKDVHRALQLQKELNFQLALAEVKQGWHYTEEIKKGKLPVFLSLDLPEEEKKESKKEVASEATEQAALKMERDSFLLKKEASLQKYVQQASLFEKEGIEFGFSYLNVKPADIKKAILRMIKAGLSEKAALHALTTYPASVLGIAHLAGTVEKGKMANLIVTDKPYFNEKANIKMVFVDGKKYVTEANSSKGDKKPEEKKGIEGTWTYRLEAAGTVRKGKIEIISDAGKYDILVSDDAQADKKEKASDVSYKDNTLSFSVVTDLESAGKVNFTLNIKDNKYDGTIQVSAFGSFPIRGEKKTDPE